MFYDIEEVAEFVRTFRPVEGRFTEEDVDNFISSIDIDKVPFFDWETGATKLVIIPVSRDYVIKIPFTGHYSGTDTYVPFFEDDYCSLEREYYDRALEEGFDDLFLSLEPIMEIKGIFIYVQPQAEVVEIEDDSLQKEYSSKDSRERIIKEYRDGNLATITSRKFPLSWVASCLDMVEKYEKLVEFFTFLDENGIWDLHYNNLGYYEGHAVIIDYGGYNEDW